MIDAFVPNGLDEFIGNSDVITCLKINIDAAIKTGESVKPFLLTGGPGLGKSTLCELVAKSLNTNFFVVNCANISHVKQIYPVICKPQDRDIALFDEIHALPKRSQEILFTVMTHNYFVLNDDKKSVRINVKNFTLAAATTNPGLIDGPLLSRFPLHYKLETYNEEELEKIARINTAKISLNVADDAYSLIIKTAKNTPRILNSRLQWIRDFAISQGIGQVQLDDVRRAFAVYGLDESGYDKEDMKYLEIVKEHGPVGIKNISDMMNISQDYIVNFIEPFLMRNEIILKTARGRVHRDNVSGGEYADLLRMIDDA